MADFIGKGEVLICKKPIHWLDQNKKFGLKYGQEFTKDKLPPNVADKVKFVTKKEIEEKQKKVMTN